MPLSPCVCTADIQGLEDHLGDMDFKVAGTRQGVTAVQLDTKLPGVPVHWLIEALQPAREARLKLLQLMEQAVQERTEAAGEGKLPVIQSLKVNKDYVVSVSV